LLWQELIRGTVLLSSRESNFFPKRSRLRRVSSAFQFSGNRYIRQLIFSRERNLPIAPNAT